MTFVVFHRADDGNRYAVNPNGVESFFPTPSVETENTRLCFPGWESNYVDVRETYGEVWEALNGAIGS